MFRRALAVAFLALIVVAGPSGPGRLEGSGPEERRDENRDLQSQSTTSQAEKSADSAAARLRPAQPPRNPRVLFIVSADCERCQEELRRLRRPGGIFETMQARGWKIGEEPQNHVQIVDAREVPDLAERLNIHEFPSVACVRDGEIVRSFKDGCTTPLDGWTFGWLLKGRNERPQAVISEAVRVHTTGSYPLRGNHWSIEGDWNPSRDRLVSHLRGPNHGTQLQSSWTIESWAYEELRSLHDDLHERELANAPASSFSQRAQPAAHGADNFSANRKLFGH